jgi:hypothetical protein
MVIFHSYGTVYQRLHIFTQTLRLCFEMIWNIWMVANISQIRPKSMLMFHARASKRDRYIYIPDNKTKRCAYWYNLVLIVLYLWVCVYIYNICMLIYTLHLYIHMCLSLCVAISNMSWLASGGEGGLKGWPCLPVAGFQLPGDQRLLSSYHESMFFFSQW